MENYVSVRISKIKVDGSIPAKVLKKVRKAIADLFEYRVCGLTSPYPVGGIIYGEGFKVMLWTGFDYDARDHGVRFNVTIFIEEVRRLTRSLNRISASIMEAVVVAKARIGEPKLSLVELG